jgi:hypothetical protein
MKYIIAVFFCLSAYTGSAAAYPRREELKEADIDFCVQVALKNPAADPDRKRVKLNCVCVQDAYWDSVPRKEIDGIYRGADLPDMHGKVAARLTAATAMCRKILGS